MTTSYVHVNSANRDMIAFPSGNAYSVYLPNPVKNVTQVEIITARIPNTIYNLTSNGPVLNTLGKNGVLLPSGFYSDPAVLATELTNRINGISSPDYNTSQSIYSTITINNLPGGSATIQSFQRSETQITVHWTKTLFSSGTTLTVWYSTSSSGPWTAFGTPSTCGDGSQTITGLTSGTTYYVALVVTGDPLYADYNTSKTVYSQTNTTIPGASLNFVSATVEDQALLISWTNTLFNNSTQAFVIIGYSPTDWFNSLQTTCGAGSYNITGLASGQNYYVALVALGDPIYSDYNNSLSIYNGPFTPSGGTAIITSITPGESSLTVHWTKTLFSSGTTLTVWYSTSSSGPWTAFGTPSTCGDGSQTITGLTNGTPYYAALVVTGDPLYADYNTSKTVYSTPSTPFLTRLLLHADGDLNDSSINNFIPLTTYGLSFSTSTVKFGSGSIYFNSSSYLAYSQPDINFPNGVDFSIECWMYPTASGQRRLFGANNNGAGWQFALWDNQTFNLYINNGGGEIFISPDNSYTLNTWQHVALCRTGNTIYLFINGNLIQTASMAGSTDNGYNWFYIGTDGFYSNPPNYQGYIDEFRIITGLNLYTSNFTPQNQPFTPPNKPAGGTATITSVTPGNGSLTVYWSTTLFSSGTTLNTYYSTDQNNWYTFGSGLCGDGSTTIPYLSNGARYYVALAVIGDPIYANYNIGNFIFTGPYSPSSGLIFTVSLDSVIPSSDLTYYQFNLTLNMPDTNLYYVFNGSSMPNVNYMNSISGYSFSGSTSYSLIYYCYSNHGVTPPETGVTYVLSILNSSYITDGTVYFSY
jgi:hypothetical protein